LDLIDQAHIILHSDVKSLIPLSDYAVEGRYAVIHDDLHDIEKYLLLVEQLREEVQNSIS